MLAFVSYEYINVQRWLCPLVRCIWAFSSKQYKEMGLESIQQEPCSASHLSCLNSQEEATPIHQHRQSSSATHVAPYGEETEKKGLFVSTKSVRSFQFIIVEEVAEMIGVIHEACATSYKKLASVNLSELLIALTNKTRLMVVEALENLEGSCCVSSQFWMGDFFPSLAWFDVLTGQIPKFKVTLSSLDSFFDQVIAQHKEKMNKREYHEQSDTKDFVDILLQLEEAGMLGFELSHDNLKAMLVVGLSSNNDFAP